MEAFEESIKAAVESPMFGILLSLLAFGAGVFCNRIFKSPIVNPLLVGISLVIIILSTTGIPLETYEAGGDFISLFLGPATTVLAYSIYRQIALLKKYFLPVCLGCLAGSCVSVVSVIGLCRLFGVEEKLEATMVPKSVTTPIAMEVSRSLGGMPSVTVAAVVVTGILGAILCPVLIRVFRIRNPIAAGVGIGTSSHAMGTSKAVELGEVQGAMSGISIGVAGILTVLISLFL